MKNFVLAAFCMFCLTGCSNFFSSEAIEKLEASGEEAAEQTEEAAIEKATGKDATVIIDVDSANSKRCYHCPQHCPKTDNTAK